MSSSSSVYGANPMLPKVERTWTQPLSPYVYPQMGGMGNAEAPVPFYKKPIVTFAAGALLYLLAALPVAAAGSETPAIEDDS